jgi:predicted DNA binding CopG/RHH family protein
MSKSRLDKSEKELLDAFERGEFNSTLTAARRKAIKAAAEQTVKKDKRINIRISGRDLDAIQRRALEEGIPYQTLVSSVLHKYVSGSLQDITANKPVKRT